MVNISTFSELTSQCGCLFFIFKICCENIKKCIDNIKIICEDIIVQRDKEMKDMAEKNLKEIMRCTPNRLGTFHMLMLLGHTLHEKDGKTYYVQINWKDDCVTLSVEE